MRTIRSFSFVCIALAGCANLDLAPTPVRVTSLAPSTFCRQMTVVDEMGAKQCRVSYEPNDTPHTANGIEDICTRWKAAGCDKSAGK